MRLLTLLLNGILMLLLMLDLGGFGFFLLPPDGFLTLLLNGILTLLLTLDLGGFGFFLLLPDGFLIPDAVAQWHPDAAAPHAGFGWLWLLPVAA